MQSIRQYREIGRFVEQTFWHEDNRSKEAVDVSARRRTPMLSLPNLGPDIQEQWSSDIEKQLPEDFSPSTSTSEEEVARPTRDSAFNRFSAIHPNESTEHILEPDSGYSSLTPSSASSLRAPSPVFLHHPFSTSSCYSVEVEETCSIKPPSPLHFHPISAPVSTFSPYSSTSSVRTASPVAFVSEKPSGEFETPRPPPPPPSPLSRQRIIPVHSIGQADPTNPHNWPLSKRISCLIIIGLLGFTQTWAGSADSSYNGAAATSLGISRVAASLNTAMFSLGIGLGSLFVGPLAETFGRNLMYLGAGFGYLVCVTGTALSRDLTGQAVSRLFVGLFVSVTCAVAGSSVHDMFDAKQRSIAFPLLALLTTVPTALAPIPGGWIVMSDSLHYHWIDWISLIIGVPAWLLGLFFLPETYSPLLQQWKAQHLRRVTGDDRYRSGLESGGGLIARLKETLPRPFVFFAREPVIIILGIYMVVLNVLLFVFLSAFEFLFQDTYGFSEGQTGTIFIFIGAGICFSSCLIPIFYTIDNRVLRQRQILNGPNATLPPEVRLWAAMIASPFMAASIFWLGWTNYRSISPWCGFAACFVFGYALMAIQVSSVQYIIDSYGSYAASALGGINVLRFVLAAGMNVASRPMFEAMGVHWTLTMVGAVAVILVPAPWVFYRYGEKLRARSRYAVYA